MRILHVGLVTLALGALAITARHAHAYPQYQLARDATCTGCHLSPAGGGLLNENGLGVAEAESWKGTDPTFFYGASLPDWLQMSGDIRGAAGAVGNGALGAAAYPMQAEARSTSRGRASTTSCGSRSRAR